MDTGEKHNKYKRKKGKLRNYDKENQKVHDKEEKRDSVAVYRRETSRNGT